MEHEEVLAWLKESGPAKLEELWARADEVRRLTVGDAVHLRGLLEISNNCVRHCGYCGVSLNNPYLKRYRMTGPDIMDCVRRAEALGYGTVVLQAGEDYGLTREFVAALVRDITSQTPLAVTLSLGERTEADLEAWREAGASRYLLRFETSDPDLYGRIHPSLPGRPSDRLALLARLRELGYETGSGVMIGIPGQTYESLARDIQLFAELDLDMIGVGPFIAHPHTPMGKSAWTAPPGEQVPATEDMTYKVLALSRLVCPEANIPATTALATLNRASGREQGLRRGANVIMPNITPLHYRVLYDIYPAKACLHETAAECGDCLRQRIEALGRTVALGPGSRLRRPSLSAEKHGETPTP